MTEIIKNCPFCGEFPKLAEDKERQYEEYTIMCDYPKCKVRPITDTFDEPYQAVSAWNKRA